MKTMTEMRSASPLRPNASSGTTPARARAKTSSGKARKTSIVRLMRVSMAPPKKPATTPRIGADDHGEQGREEGDEQGDLRAVDDAAEDVAAVDRLEPVEEVPGHAAVGADRDLGVGVDELLVELVRRVAEQAHDERGGDRDDDEVDDEEAAGERDLVALEPGPGDLAERPPLDVLLALQDGLGLGRGRAGLELKGSAHGCRHLRVVIGAGDRVGPPTCCAAAATYRPRRPRAPSFSGTYTVSNRLGRIVTRWRSSGDLARDGRSPAPGCASRATDPPRTGTCLHADRAVRSSVVQRGVRTRRACGADGRR